jgi:hypothetical protein
MSFAKCQNNNYPIKLATSSVGPLKKPCTKMVKDVLLEKENCCN